MMDHTGAIKGLDNIINCGEDGEQIEKNNVYLLTSMFSSFA